MVSLSPDPLLLTPLPGTLLNEAREAASASRQASEELEKAYSKERVAHGRTRQLALRLGMAVFVLLVLLVASVLVWWFVLR